MRFALDFDRKYGIKCMQEFIVAILSNFRDDTRIDRK